jgi:hypothetical protein
VGRDCGLVCKKQAAVEFRPLGGNGSYGQLQVLFVISPDSSCNQSKTWMDWNHARDSPPLAAGGWCGRHIENQIHKSDLGRDNADAGLPQFLGANIL